MNQNELNLLTSVFQNTKTALQSINDILPAIEDKELKHELSNEMTEYELIAKQCEMIAGNRSTELKDNNWFEKARLWTSIKVSTLSSRSTRKLAEMLVLGTVMGILECYKSINDYKKASEEFLMLCSKLLSLEEKFYNNLLEFIKNHKD